MLKNENVLGDIIDILDGLHGIFLRLQPPRRWMFVQKVDIQELLKSSYTILATFLWVVIN